MQSKAETVERYLAELPEERREALEQVREVILANLPAGYEEGMQYGMIGYYVPHSVYPPGYHCDPKQPLPFAGLASQKNHMSLYLMCVYGDPEHEAWFRKAWTATGRKLDMGKSCVRFKRIEDVPLKVVGQAVKKVPARKFIAFYEANLETGGHRRPRKQAANKAAKKSAKKPAGQAGEKVAKKMPAARRAKR